MCVGMPRNILTSIPRWVRYFAPAKVRSADGNLACGESRVADDAIGSLHYI